MRLRDYTIPRLSVRRPVSARRSWPGQDGHRFYFPLSAVPCPGPWGLEEGQLVQFRKLNRGFSKAFHTPGVAERTSFGTLPSLGSHQPKIRTIIERIA